MKNPFKKSSFCKISGITLICIVFQSCSTLNRIYSENDIVYSAKRFELEYSVEDLNRRSPLLYFTQSIIKKITSENEITYTAYDVLSLSASDFKLDEKVILIIDNEVFSMAIKKIELENVNNISENTEEIRTSDSTTVSVVSGYSENSRKFPKFIYDIPAATMEKIRQSEQLSIRYYSGPSMITLKLKKKSINKLKQLIDMV